MGRRPQCGQRFRRPRQSAVTASGPFPPPPVTPAIPARRQYDTGASCRHLPGDQTPLGPAWPYCLLNTCRLETSLPLSVPFCVTVMLLPATWYVTVSTTSP